MTTTVDGPVLVTSPQTIRTSRGLTVDVGAGVDWENTDEITFQLTGCGDCGGNFTPCVAHVKDDPNSPEVGTAPVLGLYWPIACDTFMPSEQMITEARNNLDVLTDFRLAEYITQYFPTLTTTTTTTGPYTVVQGLAAAVAAAQGLAAGQNGIMWLSSLTAHQLLAEHLLYVDGSGQLRTTVGAYHVIVIPNWYDPGTGIVPTITYTGTGIAYVSPTEVIEDFEPRTNTKRYTAERYIAIALNTCGAFSILVNNTAN